MNKTIQKLAVIIGTVFLFACNNNTKESKTVSTAAEASSNSGQANVKDDASMKDIVKIAIASPEHTTLVKALQQAELVDVLANPGPFTVFAPSNAAFEKLPK